MAKGGAGAIEKLSEAVLADPTEAWRTKATGHVNKNPDRARQHATAKLAAAMPKSPALHGPALAAFVGQNPVGKRAAAAMGTEGPQDVAARKAAKRLDALSAMATDMGAAFSHMKTTAAEMKRGSRECERVAESEPQQRSCSCSAARETEELPTVSGTKRGQGARSLSVAEP